MTIDINKISIDVGTRLQIVGTPVINGNKVIYTIKGIQAGLATVTASYDGGKQRTDTIMVEDGVLFRDLTIDNTLVYTGEDITVTATFDKLPLLEDYKATCTDGLVLKVEPYIDGYTIVAVYSVRDVGEQRVIVTYDGESKTVVTNADAPVSLKTLTLDPADQVTVGNRFTVKLKF